MRLTRTPAGALPAALLCVAALAPLGLAPTGLPAAAPRPAPAGLGALASDTLRVDAAADGPGRVHRTIGAALRAAASGDTIRVAPGTYRERLRITRPVALIGEGRPVIDGGGEGHVIEATAPLVLRGFAVRGSGSRVDEEHAGVMVRGAPAVVEDNRLEDVFYGIYLKEAAGSRVAGNRIVGKPLPLPRRGDGIRLWYSSGSEVVGNEIRRTRDLVVYFSSRLVIRRNRVSDGRYGLHYMYSDDNTFEENLFLRNQVGAFIMYSREVTLRRNVFAASSGASGMGLGLKDADAVTAEGNLFLDNASGLYLDNSPRSEAARNRFEANLFVQNGSAIRMLPSVAANEFRENSFVANDRPAEVSGGVRAGQVHNNGWAENHWGGYRGFDRDGDGVGDTPFVHAKLTDDLMARHEALRLYDRSPVMPLLETVSRFFPMLKPEPVVIDSAPRLSSPLLARWREEPPVPAPGSGQAGPGRSGGGGPLTGGPAATLWLVLAAGAGGGTWWLGRRRA